MSLQITRMKALRIGALLGVLVALLLVPTQARAADQYRVELTNIRSGLKADVMWASTAAYQGVFLWPNNASASQEFDLITMGSGFFQIRARHSGKCLMLARGGPVGNGTRIAQYPCTGPTYRSAQWSFEDMTGCPADALCVDTGKRIIRNRYTGKCLDTDNPSGKRPGQQAVLQLWTCITSPRAWNADNQIWRIFDPVTRRPVTQPR
jgi:hypothetical protein